MANAKYLGHEGTMVIIDQIKDTKSRIAGVVDDLAKTNSDLTKVSGDLTKTGNDVKTLDNNIKEVAADLESLSDEVKELTEDLSSNDAIRVISETELSGMALNDLEKNVQYNVVGKAIEFGEIYTHNHETGENQFFSISALKTLDPTKYTPIGLVAIPSTHNVYGDGTPGVMALKCARADTPDTGGAEQGISWGEYGTLDLPELPNLTTAPSLAWTPNIMPETTTQQGEVGYLCCDFGTVVNNPFDTSRKWAVKNGTHCASAFLEDGSKNTQFFKGACADVNGAGNFEIWKTAEETTGTMAAIDAVKACGDGWYLPAVGELAYAVMNRNALNTILIAAGCAKIESQNHWTSSKLNTSNARYINASNGQVSYTGGNSANLVRPVMKVSGAGSIGQFYNGTSFVDVYDESCVGIVIMPSSHDIYGDGSCCVMALRYATATGFGAATGIKFFAFDSTTHNGVFVPNTITSPYYCIGVDGMANIEHSVLGAPEGTVYIPSDGFSGQLSADGVGKYYYNSGPFGPSPYTDNGSKNPLFFGQCLSDFAGKTNTEAILSHVTLEDWQTSDTINNPTIANGVSTSMPIGEFPAACCCWRYSTPGTSQGDWYLPAEGELAYCCARKAAINSLIDQINVWKAGSGVKFGNSWYWSSTEASSWDARGVFFYSGSVGDGSRFNRLYVRPFVRVSV